MQMGASLVQYALVGTLFWLGSMTAAVVLVPDVLSALLSAAASLQVPTGLDSALNGLLSALGVSAVFATGLALDSAGVFWYRREGDWLLEEAATHEPWLRSFLSRHELFVGKDGELLLAQIGRPPEQFPGQPLFRRSNAALKSKVNEMQARIDDRGRAGTRLLGLLIALSASNDELKRQVELWRTRRSLSMALVGVAISCAVAAGVLTGYRIITSVRAASWATPPDLLEFLRAVGPRVALALAALALLMRLAHALSRRAFQDFAVALFAYTYKESSASGEDASDST